MKKSLERPLFANPLDIIKAASMANADGSVSVDPGAIAFALCGIVKSEGMPKAEFMKLIGDTFDNTELVVKRSKLSEN